MKALYLFAWSHFLRRTGIHFAGKCSNLRPAGRTPAGLMAHQERWHGFHT
jgi:hypothetical protein